MQPTERPSSSKRRHSGDANSAGDRPPVPPDQPTPSTDIAPPDVAHSSGWLNYFRQCSHLLVAVIAPETLHLIDANDPLWLLLGLTPQPDGDRPKAGLKSANSLASVLSPHDYEQLRYLYRQHLLYRVLRDFYQADPQICRILDEPIMMQVDSPLYRQNRYIQCWLRSDHLTLGRIDPLRDEFAELGLARKSDRELQARLTNPTYVDRLVQQLQVSNYLVQGCLLLEGLDITAQAIIQSITQLLIDHDSILKPQKFEALDCKMRQLFASDETVIVSIEGDQVRLFMSSLEADVEVGEYSLQTLQRSHLVRALSTNQVLVVPDLAKDCETAVGKQLVQRGVRSLLLMPLVNESYSPHQEAPQPIGAVCLMSYQPGRFDGLDCRHAQQLIPAFTMALTTALRQLRQRHLLNNIHPAVEWRFAQEADRRSWGLPPEPIVFEQVYPLYGISDIRGSSAERNRAIQLDLLEQFQLGLAVLDAVAACEANALTEQIRLDLLDHVHHLERDITVDSEITGIQYLGDRLEVHFDHFSCCSPIVQEAIDTYRAACNTEHGCVYTARAQYDSILSQINRALRETWDQWQDRMQAIIPHYCDIEISDGIDHMLYVGTSISPKFSAFHLKSLRYEQLRAMCDCARTALTIQGTSDVALQVTHLILVQDMTLDIFHDEETERMFDVRGTRDMRYEIVKKRIDKAVDEATQTRITQPGKLTIVYTTERELDEYQEYLRYLVREGWINEDVEAGTVEPLQGVNGLRFVRVQVVL